jgi:hypothetical protein
MKVLSINSSTEVKLFFTNICGKYSKALLLRVQRDRLNLLVIIVIRYTRERKKNTFTNYILNCNKTLYDI